MSDNRFRHGLVSILLGGVLAFTGCASTGTKDIKEENAPAEQAAAETQQENEAGKGISVEYINVVGEGDRVLIGTTGSIRYTVFKLSDPPRLIVDMPGVDMAKVASPISVNNDFLQDISAINYGEEKDIGRIVIGLNEGVDHEVKAGENSILVSLRKMEAQAAPEVVNASIDAEPAAEAPIAGAQSPAEDDEPAVSAAPEVKRATKILGVSSAKEGENTVIRITADGMIGNYNSFALDTPARIVVDVWGVDNSTGKDSLKLKNKYVKDVRIGSHPDKSRLVIDASAKKFPPHTVTKLDDSIIITMGPKVVPAQSVKAEPAPVKKTKYAEAAETLQVAHLPEETVVAAVEETPAPAPAETPALETEAPKAQSPDEAQKAEAAAPGVTIESVDFKKLGNAGRLTIAGSARTEYTVNESKDGKTVVIDMKNAFIPETLTRTLDATRLKTQVESISSYQESTRPFGVRVLVKLKDKSLYEVKDENGTINIDFTAPAPAAEPSAQAAKEEAPASEAVKEKEAEAVKEFTGKKIDLDMMDASISDVLRLLAEVSNLNIITSDDVKGSISLRLKNVPWDQAFDIILRSKDLDQIREGNVIRVAPAAKIRQEKEAMLVSRKAQEKLETLEMEFVPISYSTASDLLKQVQGALSERGSITSDQRTNTLIIKDVKSGIDSAKNLIKKLDTPIPQVLIEARIVEASSSFARDLGIQWGVDYQTGGNVSTNTFGSTTTSGQTPPASTDVPTFTTRSGAQNFAVNLPASGTAGTLGALGFVLGKAGVNPLILDLRLSAGESEGQLKTISRPRITTMDNKEAKIEQGESIPFETTSASGTSTTFVDANLSLTVTPHITPDGSVLMKIKASRNSIGTFRTSAGQPSINKKESSTEVLVTDGETTVIGGIVISDKSETERGIPLLKDIPLIGWFFKNKSVSDTQTELLIFITPTIMKEKITG